jgi:hypothetical protein
VLYFSGLKMHKITKLRDFFFGIKPLIPRGRGPPGNPEFGCEVINVWPRIFPKVCDYYITVFDLMKSRRK